MSDTIMECKFVVRAQTQEKAMDLLKHEYKKRGLPAPLKTVFSLVAVFDDDSVTEMFAQADKELNETSVYSLKHTMQLLQPGGFPCGTPTDTNMTLGITKCDAELETYVECVDDGELDMSKEHYRLAILDYPKVQLM